jgi:hypothetical protein
MSTTLERKSRLALDDGLPRARRMRRLVGVDDRVDDGLSAPFLALGALLLEPINSGRLVGTAGHCQGTCAGTSVVGTSGGNPSHGVISPPISARSTHSGSTVSAGGGVVSISVVIGIDVSMVVGAGEVSVIDAVEGEGTAMAWLGDGETVVGVVEVRTFSVGDATGTIGS